MRLLKVCALSLALIPILLSAEANAASKTNCKDFAKEQLQKIKQDYYGALTRDEVALTLEVAERSCLAMYDAVEEERGAITTQPQSSNTEKTHWWDELSEEGKGKAIPNIKKVQQSGGK